MIIPVIPTKKTDFKKLKYNSETDIGILIREGYQLNSNNREMSKQIDINRDIVYKQIKNYMKRRYNNEFDFNEFDFNEFDFNESDLNESDFNELIKSHTI